MTLADREDWLVPVARHAWGEPAFPRLRVLDDDGSPAWGDVREDLRDLWGAACRAWEALDQALLGEEPAADLADADLFRLSVGALALNYRLGPVEVDFLGLFTDEIERRVLLAVLDWPTVERARKAVEAREGPAGAEVE